MIIHDPLISVGLEGVIQVVVVQQQIGEKFLNFFQFFLYNK
jgi:hypothetical protein